MRMCVCGCIFLTVVVRLLLSFSFVDKSLCLWRGRRLAELLLPWLLLTTDLPLLHERLSMIDLRMDYCLHWDL
jgi:hypothetical protein